MVRILKSKPTQKRKIILIITTTGGIIIIIKVENEEKQICWEFCIRRGSVWFGCHCFLSNWRIERCFRSTKDAVGDNGLERKSEKRSKK